MTKPKEATTFGLSSEKLAQLLGIRAQDNLSDTGPSEMDLKAELLRDRLAETLSVCKIASAPSRRQTQMAHTIADLGGEPIGTLLLDPLTDLALVRRIKDHGRKLAESAKSKTERHVANTLYYAAIAAALVYHHQKITTHTDQDLQAYFTRLGGEEWISDSLRRLFDMAKQECIKDAGD